MAEHLLAALVAIRVIAWVLATILVVLAVRAWQATRDKRMARLTLGFTMLLASLAIEGLFFQFLLPGDLLVAHVVESATALVALGFFIWALF